MFLKAIFIITVLTAWFLGGYFTAKVIYRKEVVKCPRGQVMVKDVGCFTPGINYCDGT
jgi:uncharacterized protein YneF (UPF0154 family)